MVVGHYRYEGFPLEQKIAWIREGAGPGALAEARSALAELTGALVESEQRLRDLVARLGGAWEGSAAVEAGAVVRQAALWSGDSGLLTRAAGTQVDLQAEQVRRTANGMPGSAPRPEYGFDDALGDGVAMTTHGLFDVQTDFDARVAARRAADEEANRILYEHEAASRVNVANLPVLEEMPRITAESEPPATVCPPVGVERHEVVREPARTDRDDVGPQRTGEDGARDRRGETGFEDRKTDDRKTGGRDDGAADTRPGRVEGSSPSPDRAGLGLDAVRPAQPGPPGVDAVSTSSSAPVVERPEGGVRPPVAEAPQPGARPGFGPGTGVTPPLPLGGIGGGRDLPRSAGGGGLSGGAPGARSVGGRGGALGGVPGAVAPGAAGVGRDAALGAGRRSGVLDGARGTAASGEERAGRGRAAAAGGGGTFGQPGVGARGEGSADVEHTDRYYLRDGDLFGAGERRGVAPVVLGEDPEWLP